MKNKKKDVKKSLWEVLGVSEKRSIELWEFLKTLDWSNIYFHEAIEEVGKKTLTPQERDWLCFVIGRFSVTGAPDEFEKVKK